ncbi:MFS transporter [Microbacterium gorillae]|uniref:MFS transporter n=1 Tax=Microbacterium gorillae TaxID=1231063 RepID=UPI00058B1CCC|nr:MFS transporter [Microbacterium gorillae]
MSVPRTARVGARWMTLFAAAWLAIWTVQLTPVQLLLPIQLNTPDDAAGWVGGVVSTGVVLGIGGLAGVIAGPLAGMLSDRTRTRFGRRRPWALGGVLMAAVFLVATGMVHGPWPVGLTWTGVSVGLAVASAAFTAMIADQLPEQQRGTAASLASSAQAVGIIVGVGTVVLFGLGVFAGYLVLAGIIAVVGSVAALLLPDPPPTHEEEHSPGNRRDALRDPDFAWMLAGRLVLNIGNALGTTLLLFFLMYGLGQGSAAEDNLLIAILVYTVFVVLASFLSGWWSDRTGRRRIPTVVSAAIQGVAAALLVFSPTWTMTLIAAALLGVGYGAFMTTGLAFATDLLPDPARHARDLGVVTVTAALGQLLGPLIGGVLVAAVGGFWLLFAASAVLSLVGAGLTALARERPPAATT